MPLLPKLFRLPRSVTGTLALLVIVVLVATFALQAHAYSTRIEQRRDAELTASLEMARATALAFEAFLHDLLGEFAPIGAFLTASPRADRARVEGLLRASAAEYPVLRDVSWLGAGGQLLASSTPRAAHPPDGSLAADLVRAGQDWIVSDLTRAPPDGEPVFFVARAVRGPDGAIVGVLVATVVAARLGQSALPFQRSGGAAIVLVDRRGQLVYRRPEVSLAWQERQLLSDGGAPGDPLLRTALAGGEARGSIVARTSGRRLLAATVPVPMIGWAAGSSRPLEEALAPAHRGVLMGAGYDAALLAVGLALAIALARRIVSPLRALEKRAGALGGGVPPASLVPMRLRELESLAGAFDQMQAEVAAREQQREDLLSVVSHDLRSPLAAIAGQVQIALKRSPPDPWYAARASAIQVAAKRMGAMIEDLLDAARFEANQLRLQLEPVEVTAFAHELLARVGPSLEAERIEIELNVSPGTVMLVDPGRIERVLVNLLTNALKYSPPESRVRFEISGGERGVTLAVADQGPGIPAEDLPHVFDRFYRGKQTAGRGGVGLGLYSAHVLVQAHGGRLRVETTPGRGSVFYVELGGAPR